MRQPAWSSWHSHSIALQLRHITANGLVPLATADQLEGLAACMQTRCARSAQRCAPCALSHPSTARASSSPCTRTTAVSLSATWAWSYTSLLAEQAEAELAWRASPRRTRRMSSKRLAVPLLRRRSSSWHWCLSPLSPLLPWLLARQCARPWRTCCRSCRPSA